MWSMYSIGMMLAGIGATWETLLSLSQNLLLLWILAPHRKPPDKPQEPRNNTITLPRKRQLNPKRHLRHLKIPRETRNNKMRVLLLELMAAQKIQAGIPQINISQDSILKKS